MASRNTFYAENTSSSSTTETTYQDYLTLTFTPAGSQDYIVFWSGEAPYASTTIDTQIRVYDDTNAVTFSELNNEGEDTLEVFSFSGFAKFTSVASPGEHNFKIQFSSETGTSVNIDNSTICVFEMHADDEYGESLGQSDNSTQDTWLETFNLTFTPGSTGNYLVMASAEISGSSIGNTRARLLHNDGTDYFYNNTRYARNEVGNWHPFFGFVDLSLGTSSQDFALEHHPDASSVTSSTRKARILAIRLDTLDDYHYAESRTESTSTDETTFTDKVTLTETPANKKHLVLYAAMMYGSSSSNRIRFKFLEGATDEAELVGENQANSAFYTGFGYEKTLAASSTTWKIQFRRDNTADTSKIAEASIALLQFEGASGTTYNDNATFVSRHGFTNQAALTQNPDNTFVTRCGFTTQGALVQPTDISFIVRAGFTTSETYDINGNITTGVRMGFTDQPELTLSPQVTYVIRQGFTANALAELVADASFVARMGFQATGNLIQAVDLTNLVRLGASVSAGQVYEDTVNFLMRLGFTAQESAVLASSFHPATLASTTTEPGGHTSSLSGVGVLTSDETSWP